MNKYVQIYGRSRTPLYLQVASVIRQRIETGEWAEGEKISTLEVLEKEFAVARVTVRQAIELLRNEGLLDAQQGRGTFVSGRPEDNRWFNLASDFSSLVESLKKNVLKCIHIQENVTTPNLADGEGLAAEAYTFLKSVQYNDSKPFSVVNLYLAQHIFQADAQWFTHSAALPRLVEMDDIDIVHAYHTVTIGVAEWETANLLNIGLGEPISDCRLVLVDGQGVAIYIADIHYHKDCFSMRTDLLRRPAAYDGAGAKKRASANRE